MDGSNLGVDFNFSFAPGVTDEQILGFELAGDIWSQYLHDTYNGEGLDINIYVAMGDDILPDDVVGGAFPAIESGIAYRDVYNALQNDFQNEIETETDKIATDSLLNSTHFPVLVGEEIIWKNPEMQATRANLKALKLIEGNSSELDGFIVMNSLVNTESVSWNYNYLEGPQAGEIDFLSVAMHELGHNLGFVSGVDIYGWNEQSADFEGTGIGNLTTLDLFRYSEKTFAIQDVSYRIMLNDLTFGRAAYFSIDRTAENAIAMSTGTDYQGSHWKNGDLETGMGIMNPTIRLGERWEISETDLTAFDAIGWDVDYNATVDFEKLFIEAQSNVDPAPIVDFSSEVDIIFSGEAYQWAWRSSTASSSGYWWAWSSSTASSSGYWSTYSTDTLSTDTSYTTTDTSYTTTDYDPSSLEDIGGESILDDSVLDRDINDEYDGKKKK